MGLRLTGRLAIKASRSLAGRAQIDIDHCPRPGRAEWSRAHRHPRAECACRGSPAYNNRCAPVRRARLRYFARLRCSENSPARLRRHLRSNVSCCFQVQDNWPLPTKIGLSFVCRLLRVHRISSKRSQIDANDPTRTFSGIPRSGPAIVSR
jgi:hypothetical protein